MSKKIGKFYDIMTTEGSNEATIFLYGYIGPDGDIDDMGYLKKGGNTDIEFVKEIDRLATSYSQINIRINSWGGEIYHGLAIVSAIQRCKSEVHTYIDGLAASMAGVIWLAGKKRHMAKNGMLMLHAGSNIVWGNAKDMREMADILDQFTKTMVLAIAESTGQTAESINEKYFADCADHFLTYEEALTEKSWINAQDDYQASENVPEALSRMTYQELVAHFKEKESPKGLNLMQQMKTVFADIRAALMPKTAIQSPLNIKDMNLEDFKKSVADGTLLITEVTAHLKSLTPSATPDEDDDEDDLDEKAEITALKASIAALTAKFEKFGAAPGAQKSAPSVPSDDLPLNDGGTTDKQRYEAMNAQLDAAATTGAPLKVQIS